MKIGFIGLGNVGGKLAGNLIRNGYNMTVRDVNSDLLAQFSALGAQPSSSPRELAEQVDVVITCLPSPSICSQVMEGDNGVIAGLSKGKIWLEMSTTDQAEVVRIEKKVAAKGAFSLDSPVSGGCHRAETGNISILAGGDRSAFDQVLPILTTLGKQVIHTGPVGSASALKVVTNFLASAHLAALAESWVVIEKLGIDTNVAFEAIRASSGNSFVHETESQVILNGSRNISFTMDLVVKDVTLFDTLAKQHGMHLELSPLLVDIFNDGMQRYGPREWSSNIIQRLEDDHNVTVRGKGFPSSLTDKEQKEVGAEVVVEHRSDY